MVIRVRLRLGIFGVYGHGGVRATIRLAIKVVIGTLANRPILATSYWERW